MDIPTKVALVYLKTALNILEDQYLNQLAENVESGAILTGKGFGAGNWSFDGKRLDFTLLIFTSKDTFVFKGSGIDWSPIAISIQTQAVQWVGAIKSVLNHRFAKYHTHSSFFDLFNINFALSPNKIKACIIEVSNKRNRGEINKNDVVGTKMEDFLS